MTATAIDKRLNRVLEFYDAPIGKKVIMALTGLIGFGFVLVHMAGNLQIFLGQEPFDHYAVLLRRTPGLLWAIRLALISAFLLHILAAIQLTALKKNARPVEYKRRKAIGSTLSSRIMGWSGTVLALFIVYHVLHFTLGTVHPDFHEGRVYDNVLTAFRSAPISILYVLCMALLGLHLQHGLWSLFQSLGLDNPRYSEALRKVALGFAVVVTAGFICVPVAVLTGLVS
jgi:succinate dehydrogenase cytochrome b subunit